MVSKLRFTQHPNVRYCLLGSQCDMFEYDTSSSTCRYLPHVQLKTRRWIDFLQQADDMHATVSQD